MQKSLVGTPLFLSEFAQLRQQSRINAKSNELFRLASLRSPNAAGFGQFCLGRLRDVAEIDFTVRKCSASSNLAANWPLTLVSHLA